MADKARPGDVAVVGPGGHDQQRVDTAAQQRCHQLALACRVLTRGGGDQQARVLARDVLDRLGHTGVERVGDILDHQPDRVGADAAAQAGRQVVALVAERFDRRLDLAQRRGGDPGFAVDHSRDGLEADAGSDREVVHRRLRAAFALSAAGRG